MNNEAKRPMSQQAQVAKRIKSFCKDLGVKCSAKSDSFSMGDSVTATVYDQPPEMLEKITEFAESHQYGNFNGMEDIYEYSNERGDIPQSKYVHVDNNYSDELRQDAWNAIRELYSDAKEGPLSAKDADQCQVMGEWGSTYIYRFLRGSLQPVLCVNGPDRDYSAEFWATRKPEVKAVTVSAEGCHIKEHVHTKKNFLMYIVVMESRVDREDFNALRDKAESLGGWYSRKWGTTPGGFAFKEREAAESFLSDNPAPTNTPPDSGLGDKLRTLADKMQDSIEDKFRDRQTNTPKRQREAGSARLEGERLQRTQEGLNRLADLHDAGAVPPILLGVKSKKAAYELARSKIEHQGGYYDAGRCQGVPSSDSAEAVAFWDILKGKSEGEKKADDLREMENKLMFASIPGFFPTPNPVIDLMLERAEIEPHHTILEPSAGSGAIADRVKAESCSIDCVEVNHSLNEILRAKGHNVIGENFTASIFSGYDRVLMNPPFEKMQDMKHVEKAFDCLAPGGRLVAIISPSAFFRSGNTPAGFRAFFDRVGGEKVELPAGSFKESGTGVSSVMVVIDKES
jgi:hypothetical protein